MSKSRFSMVPTAAILDASLDRIHIYVLTVLATYNDPDHKSWPSQSTIAKRGRISRETVNKALKLLVTKGYVQSFHRSRRDGGRASNIYQIIYDRDLHIASCDPEITGGVKPEITRGVKHASQQELEPLITKPTERYFGQSSEDDVQLLSRAILNSTPEEARERTNYSLILKAAKQALREYPSLTADDIGRAWAEYVETPNAQGNYGEFCKSPHLWLRDGRFEAYLDNAA